MKTNKLFVATLLIALGSIFVNCSPKTGDTKASGKDSTALAQAEANTVYNGKIAYVKMDTLMRSYGLFIDLSDEFTKKGKQVETQITSRGRALEREVAAYQEKAGKGLISRFEIQSIEEGLQQKNQSLMQYRDKMMAELQQEEVTMMNQISENIMAYLKEYNTEKGYSMILQTSGSNPILIADPANDITEEVLKALNERYLESKGTAAKIQTVEAETVK